MKGINRIEWVGWIIAISLILSPMIVHAWAEDLLSHFQAYIDVQEEYNSNINLTPNRVKQDDFITTVTPGFKISTSPRSPVTGQFQPMPTGDEKYTVDLDFRVGFNFYAKNHEENYISLNGLLNAWYALSKNLNFRVRDYLIRSDDIREPDYSATAIQGQYLPSRIGKRTPWIRNAFEPSLQYEFGRKDDVTIDSLAINYRNNIYRIQGSTGEDSTENFINPTLTYWFDIKNGISLGYGFTIVDYERSPNVIINTANGRYTYRFNPRTSIFLNYVQTWVNNEFPRPDYVIYNPTIGVDHSFSPTLSGTAQVGYYLADPSRGSNVSAPSFKISLTQKGKKTIVTILMDGGYTLNYMDVNGSQKGFTQYYRALGNINYQLLQKMNVGLSGSYEWEKWPRPVLGGRGQTDNIWEIGGNASYDLFKWLKLSLQLYYTQNNSNINSADYSEYRGIFKITATY